MIAMTAKLGLGTGRIAELSAHACTSMFMWRNLLVSGPQACVWPAAPGASMSVGELGRLEKAATRKAERARKTAAEAAAQRQQRMQEEGLTPGECAGVSSAAGLPTATAAVEAAAAGGDRFAASELPRQAREAAGPAAASPARPQARQPPRQAGKEDSSSTSAGVPQGQWQREGAVPNRKDQVQQQQVREAEKVGVAGGAEGVGEQQVQPESQRRTPQQWKDFGTSRYKAGDKLEARAAWERALSVLAEQVGGAQR